MGSLPSLNRQGVVKVEAERHEYRDSEMVRLGEHQDGYERFTTGELYRLEQEIIQMVDQGRESTKHCVSDATLGQSPLEQAHAKD